MGVAEVLDSRTASRFKLNNRLTIVCLLGIDDNLEFHAFLFHDALEGLEVDPQVVRVKDLEFAD